MATSGYPPIASNSIIVTDCGGGNNDGDGGRSDASSDYDEEEGEPPSIPPFHCPCSRDYLFISKFAPIMTAVGCKPHEHYCPVAERTSHHDGPAKISRRGRGYSWFATVAAIVMVLLSSPTMSSAVDSSSSDIPAAIAETPMAKNQASPGVRGAIQPVSVRASSEHENCDYECCLSFIDVISQSEHNLENIFQQSGSMRMLQDSTTSAVPNPCPPEEESGGVPVPVAVQYILIIILVAFSALFSGLTLGLMSLDPSGLEIVMANSDDPAMARAAKAIYPVRLNGNLLLCTLLLGNVGVNSMLSILMADLTSGLVGFIVSTCVIVIFGEIIPQAICSRFALQVGEKTVPLVKFIIFLLYPICKPLSMILNKVLGHEIGTTYSTSEMAKLIEMHVQRGELEGATGDAMKGALRYRTMAVSEVMTPLVNTFLLSADERLGFDTVAKIFKTGYSRIPVYEVSKSNIIGLLFVKDLIFLDPEDEIPVKNFVQIFGRGLHVVWPDDKLGDVLKMLKRGRSHMALVRGVNDGDGKVDPYYEIKGIITLEDIIEIILGDEIVDETDELVDVNDPDSVVNRTDIGEYIEGSLVRSGRDSPIVGGAADDVGSVRAVDWEARLRLLDERLVDEHLSSDEVRAVAAHLKTNYSKSVELISDRQLKELLSLVPVTEINPALTCTTADGEDDESGVPSDSAELIYARGVPTDFCTVVLSGKIVVMSGADKFRSDVSNWGVLAARALTDPEYVPDFSAWVLPNQNSSGGCRCVKLDRKSYGEAVDNTALERTDHNVDIVRPTAVSAIITKSSPLVLNGGAEEESPSQKGMGSNVTPVSANIALDKADSTGQINGSVQHTTNDQLPPQTPGEDVQVVPSTPYVRTVDQKKTHSRRSQLLKAFSHATSHRKEKG